MLASGPSMSAEVAEQVRGLRVIVVNDTVRLAPWAAMLYAADVEWWQLRSESLASFKGLRVSVAKHRGVHQLVNTGDTGFDPDPRNIRTGGNSGYQAVHIAAQAGADRILLCGFDMHGGHWHANYQHPLRETGPDTYLRWVERFATLKTPARIINCTPGSALRCFEAMTLEDALCEP